MYLPLDIEGQHGIRVESHGDRRARLTLVHLRGDRGSALHRALQRVLRVRTAAAEHALGEDTGALEIEAPCALLLAGRVVAELAPAPTSRYLLSAFECRYLAEYGRAHAIPPGEPPAPALETDLHTHFAGCVEPAALIELGAAHGVRYPAALLAEVGIRSDVDLRVETLSPPMRSALARALAVPTERRITFLEMERIYRLRGPLTKHPAMFVPLLERLAADYAAMGVRYVELSLGDILRADRLQAVHDHAPRIEAATGVTVRFLAAMSRHDDLEWDLDYIDRLRELGASRYLVGVDFMGHETNSTRAFARQLDAVAEWAGGARPGFAVRVHAGENPAHPENVRVALDHLAHRDVSVRIGHGLYGVDEETVDRLAANGVIVEFNLNSNFALNNIQTVTEAPIRRYLRRGVGVVLSSDGYGIYGSRPELEARAAWLCGVEPAAFARIRATEQAYLAHRARADAATRTELVVPPDRAPVHYSPEVRARADAARTQRDRRLHARLDELGLESLSVHGLSALLAGRRCLSIAGAWKHSWERLPPADRAAVETVIAELFDALDPGRTAVLTGGTEHGVEALVAAHARRRGVPHIGVLVAETPPASIAASGLDYVHLAAESLHAKAAALYRVVGEAHGLALFVGGGNIVSDEIQTARNLRVRYLLLAGIAGASAEHARQQPHRSFTRATEVIDVLTEAPSSAAREPLRHPGPNPTVDVVLTRAHPVTGALEVLLIRRDLDAAAERGSWALPGGFMATDAPSGQPWRLGVEHARAAALRELYEETGLELRAHEPDLIEVGIYEHGGRDPRDSEHAWSRSTAFALRLPDALATRPIAGADDACDAAWFPATELPLRLAFDHARIIADALAC